MKTTLEEYLNSEKENWDYTSLIKSFMLRIALMREAFEVDYDCDDKESILSEMKTVEILFAKALKAEADCAEDECQTCIKQGFELLAENLTKWWY